MDFPAGTCFIGSMSFLPRLIPIVVLAISSSGLVSAQAISTIFQVSPANCEKLDNHDLEIKGDSRNGITHVMIRIRPESGYQLDSCHAIIYASAASKPPILASFKLDITGELLYFSVADELVDRVSVTYQLNASPLYTAVFEIGAGQLRKLMGQGK